MYGILEFSSPSIIASSIAWNRKQKSIQIMKAIRHNKRKLKKIITILTKTHTWINVCDGSGLLEITIVAVHSHDLVVQVHGKRSVGPNCIGPKAGPILLDGPTV